MRLIVEAPPIGDGVDAVSGQQSTLEVGFHVFQPLGADVGGHGDLLIFEQSVKVPGRDVVGRGDRVGAQGVVPQVLTNPGDDL